MFLTIEGMPWIRLGRVIRNDHSYSALAPLLLHLCISFDPMAWMRCFRRGKHRKNLIYGEARV
jgi:hypothetical protein